MYVIRKTKLAEQAFMGVDGHYLAEAQGFEQNDVVPENKPRAKNVCTEFYSIPLLRLPSMKQPSQCPIMKVTQEPSPRPFRRTGLVNKRLP